MRRTPVQMSISRRALVALLSVVALAVTTMAAPAGAKPDDGRRGGRDAGLTLTILHNNDGESQLLNAGNDLEDFGGIGRFATVAEREQKAARRGRNTEYLMVSSGDNFLAGPEFQASLEDGVFYDARALGALGYDAIALGNHDFDFGPELLADFLDGYRRNRVPQYLTANMDFSGEPELQAFVDSGVIAPSVVIRKGRHRIGVIGAITPELARISSPRNAEVLGDVAGIVQAEIDSLTDDGVEIIVLISHLQGIDEDVALASQLSGIDVMVAGGGDEVLANDGDLLVPGDVVFDSYPVLATNADGATVPVVTTAGDYKYLGRLVVEFDADGNVTAYEGGPIRIAGGEQPDAVDGDRRLARTVEAPVAAFTDALAENVIANSEVALEGRRDPGIRTEETNLGNLMADSLLFIGEQEAANFGVAAPDVAIQNGGGIRNNTLIPAGPITELDTFSIAPFTNFVTVVPDLEREQFRQLLERGFSGAPGAEGRFPQIAGMAVTYDTARTAQELADDDTIAVPGDRVTSIVLDDGTVICCDAANAVLPGAPVGVATIDFLARGGDGYPYGDAPFTSVGVSYQQALSDYITGPLTGTISAADYPEGGEGRIVVD